MALKTEKFRKYYLKCSNTFLAGCKQFSFSWNCSTFYKYLLFFLLYFIVYIYGDCLISKNKISIFFLVWISYLVFSFTNRILFVQTFGSIKYSYDCQSIDWNRSIFCNHLLLLIFAVSIYGICLISKNEIRLFFHILHKQISFSWNCSTFYKYLFFFLL